MDDQQVFELGQLYAELALIRGMISGGAGIRQRLLTQSECERIEMIGTICNDQIRVLMRLIDTHKCQKSLEREMAKSLA